MTTEFESLVGMWQIQVIRVSTDLDCDIGIEHLKGTKSAKVEIQIVSRTPSWSSW